MSTSGTSWLPLTDDGLKDWSQNFVDRIEPGVTPPYGLSSQMRTDYIALHDAYVAALTAAQQDITRTPVVIGAKNRAKDDLIAKARELVAFIQGNPATTDTDRRTVQIRVRDTEPSPVPAPALWPQIMIRAVNGYIAEMQLADLESPLSGRKPAGVVGANVFVHVGETAPEFSEFTFHGNATRLRVPVSLPNTLAPATKVWITAMWYNTKGQTSQPAPPVPFYVGTAVSDAA